MYDTVTQQPRGQAVFVTTILNKEQVPTLVLVSEARCRKLETDEQLDKNRTALEV